jgi:hypothetical protein
MSHSSPPEMPKIFSKRPPRGRSTRLAVAAAAVLGLPLAALAYKLGAPRLSAFFKPPAIRAFMMADPEGRRSLRLDKPDAGPAAGMEQTTADSTKLIRKEPSPEVAKTAPAPPPAEPTQTAWAPPTRVAPPAPSRPEKPQPEWPHLKPGAHQEINDQENRALLESYPGPASAPAASSPSPILRIVPWRESSKTSKPGTLTTAKPGVTGNTPVKKRLDLVPLQPSPNTAGAQTSITPTESPTPARWLVQPPPTAAPAPTAVIWGSPPASPPQNP